MNFYFVLFGKSMDRRQRKTKKAIYSAFIELLGSKDFSSISVQEIIDKADVGRATFYAHFETKDYLLKEICEELFGHILGNTDTHYECDYKEHFLLHLLRHIKNNDDNILKLLKGRNNELFLGYFRKSLEGMILSATKEDVVREIGVPKDFVVNFIAVTFTQMIFWWAEREFAQSPQQICAYFEAVVGEKINKFCKFN